MYERFNLAFCGKILGMEIPWEFLQVFPWVGMGMEKEIKSHLYVASV